MAESRQFGGCFVLGVQVASALRDLYGRNGAETLSGLCGTRVVFAAPDRDTAQWSADSLGRSEVEEFAEGVSYGADPYRDGVTLTPKREVQALALPSEIMRLPNLNGYLKLPGPHPVARIELRYVKRPKVAERFLPRTPPERPSNGAVAQEEDRGADAEARGRQAAGPESSAAEDASAGAPTEHSPAPAAEPEQQAMAMNEPAVAEMADGGPAAEITPETTPEAPDAAGESDAPAKKTDGGTARGNRVNFA